MPFHHTRLLIVSGLLMALSTIPCRAMEPAASQAPPLRIVGKLDQDHPRWYHASAGTQLMPYDWFVALLDSTSKEFEKAGILVDSIHPDRLPVGMSEPQAGAPSSSPTGMNCAFCHTTEFTYGNKVFRIEGGPSLQYNQRFLGVLIKALRGLVLPDLPTLLKSIQAERPLEPFKTFATKVLERRQEGSSISSLSKLAGDVDAYSRSLVTRGAMDSSPEWWGPGRFDALGRGGNTVFGPLNPDNLRPANAPVSIPPLWGVWAYDWVQWSGSIQHPLARNVAQVIGVGANLFAWTKKPPLGPMDDDQKFRSSVDFKALEELEGLAGRLQPPRWPEEFPAIDRSLAARGRDLYHGNKAKGIPNLCAHCHVARHLENRGEYGPGLQVTMIPQKEVGTDPLYLESFSRRTVDTGPLGRGRLSAKDASQYVTTELLARSSAAQTEDAAKPNEWRDWPQYIARPHLAVWATAPFLHNGSVPNLYELLSPVSERHRCFALSPRMEFDPKHVGYSITECNAELPQDRVWFKFDTAWPGNGNRGHEFADLPGCEGPAENGLLGCGIPPADRLAIIEYLKTCDLDRRVIPGAPACHDLGEVTP
ncbi:MAG: hypothetical protein UZ03_NOB001002565 [Nitrospira sp. OLB3]|nr:MAG: hypothetical protein UZ03_NOB001002565 [Nitrospira sp. OLB3]